MSIVEDYDCPDAGGDGLFELFEVFVEVMGIGVQ